MVSKKTTNSGVLKSLKDYYRVDSTSSLCKSFIGDILVSSIIFSGTGLITSIIKGVLAHIFISAGSPLLIGKRFRVRHPSNLKIGSYVTIKDDVSILADGPISIGNNCIIAEKSILTSYKNGLTIGSNVVIGKYCYLAQNGGTISIGNNVLMSDFVRIYTLNHKFDKKNVLKMNQECEYTNVRIKDNVIIGSGTVIFNNITIGSGSVIGANSVVNKDVPDNVVYAGNPAKLIKKIR